MHLKWTRLVLFPKPYCPTPCLALCPKFFQIIEGPSESLLGIQIRSLHRPNFRHVAPPADTDLGELSRLVL